MRHPRGRYPQGCLVAGPVATALRRKDRLMATLVPPPPGTQEPEPAGDRFPSGPTCPPGRPAKETDVPKSGLSGWHAIIVAYLSALSPLIAAVILALLVHR